MTLSLSRIAPLMAADQPDAVKLAKKIFPKNKGDKIRVSLTGGKKMQFSMSMDTKLLQFFAELQEGGGDADADADEAEKTKDKDEDK